MFVRSGFPFNYDADAVSEATGLRCEDPSRAQQSAAEEADINTIVRRFNLTGQLPQSVQVPTYSDFEGVFDFQSAMNIVRQATEAFMEFPADVRARFHNSEQEFLQFVEDPANYDEAVRLGIANPPTPPLPTPAATPLAPEAPVTSGSVPGAVSPSPGAASAPKPSSPT